MLTRNGNTGGVDLGVTWIGENSPFFIGAPASGHVAALGVGGEIENISVSARGQDHGVRGVGGNLASDQIADDNAFGMTINNDDIEHFRARIHLNGAKANLAAEGLISSKKQLLAGLASG